MNYPWLVPTGGSLCLCVFVFQLFFWVHGLVILKVKKEMIETQRHKDTEIVESLINIEIIKLYTAPRNLFGNGELKVNTRMLLVILLKLKNPF
jgi:hypothetical protein